MAKRTYRNPVALWGGGVAFVACLLLAAVPTMPLGGRILFGLGSLVFAWAAFWVRLTTDSDGAAAFYGRPKRVRWVEVEDVALRLRWGVPALVLAGEHDLTVWAVAETIKGGGLSYCRRATREVQQTWATATGRPLPDHVEAPELRGEDAP